MQTILQQTEKHTLTLEKVSGKWWLELIDRASGHTRIINMSNRTKAKAFFDRMTMPEIIRVYDKLNVKETPMYKAGVM